MTNPVIDLLMSHRSIRSYEDKPIPPEIVETLLNCAQKSPTSSYLQAFSIIEVTDPAKREVLKTASGGQEWVVKAPLAFLFCADLHRLECFLPLKDKNVLHNEELFSVAVIDTALAAQKLYIAAQAFGLGGVVVGGVRNDMKAMAEAFELPSLVYPMFVLTLGYPAESRPQSPRLPLELVTAKDKYPDIENTDKLSEYDETVSKFYEELTNGEDCFSWVSRCTHALTTKPRYAVGEFLHNAGFLTENEPNIE